MCRVKSKRNNLDLKQVLPGRNNRAEMDMGNTIGNYVKSYQVKNIIVNYTDTQLKGWKILTAHGRYVAIANIYVT